LIYCAKLSSLGAAQWRKVCVQWLHNILIKGDKLIDLAEYMEVLSYYNIGRMEAVTCFDKIAKVCLL
uniref:Pentatricopeptide repeat-containing protein n=1 Tax=Toxocara canis TaxID=6265 RepID=A0A183U3Y2_TOXCA